MSCVCGTILMVTARELSFLENLLKSPDLSYLLLLELKTFDPIRSISPTTLLIRLGEGFRYLGCAFNRKNLARGSFYGGLPFFPAPSHDPRVGVVGSR